ncbi:hypothetical protein AB4099_27230 [Bosea sp. 2KB_26]|uniref:hypothetical protein n=1 Tax=Bosea sp. 2KB_26 TaxID=3237475 RepID=UPI003F906E18
MARAESIAVGQKKPINDERADDDTADGDHREIKRKIEGKNAVGAEPALEHRLAHRRCGGETARRNPRQPVDDGSNRYAENLPGRPVHPGLKQQRYDGDKGDCLK